MADHHVVKTLNDFLKGQYMGIHAYEHYIQKVTDSHMKKEFQWIQQEIKHDASKVAERIQNLGGTPVDDEGLMGSIQGYIGYFMIPDQTSEIIDGAIKGEDKGIQMADEIVKGDLDPESHQLIEEILNKDRHHVEMLKGFIQSDPF